MMIKDPNVANRLKDLEERMAGLRKEMQETLSQAAACEVKDYVFATPDGKVKLSDLFGGKKDLFVIHNMGKGCSYCTLWADGFNGVYDHLADRASFVLSSPDSPDVQKAFAESRGWRFPMVSTKGSSFAADLGFASGDGVMPGTSVFQMEGGKIRRVSMAVFGPGDDYCSVWHLMALLPQGPAGWEPKYQYA